MAHFFFTVMTLFALKLTKSSLQHLQNVRVVRMRFSPPRALPCHMLPNMNLHPVPSTLYEADTVKRREMKSCRKSVKNIALLMRSRRDFHAPSPTIICRSFCTQLLLCQCIETFYMSSAPGSLSPMPSLSRPILSFHWIVGRLPQVWDYD